MAEVTNKEDYAQGFGAALALLGVCIFAGVTTYVVRGGKLENLNPLDKIMNNEADDSETFRFQLNRDSDGNRRMRMNLNKE